MGTWGIDNFENDHAMDWTWDLTKSKDHSVVLAALDAVIGANAEDREGPECCEALAAAEVVAAMAGRTPANLPEDVAASVEQHKGGCDASLMARATAAVEAVRSDSELKDLWEATDDFGKWNMPSSRTGCNAFHDATHGSNRECCVPWIGPGNVPRRGNRE